MRAAAVANVALRRVAARVSWATCVLLALADAHVADAANPLPVRLPGHVSPVHYDISFEPDAGALAFHGRETIDLVVRDESAVITLNALDLTLTEVSMDGTAAVAVAMNPDAQTATLTFPASIPVGQHRLTLSFAGKINTGASGVFFVDYGTAAGMRRMLTTQLEPADGRRFVPMWDEPAAKATFALEVVIPAGQDAISNMPEASRRFVGPKTHVRFQTTPKMSSYLLHVTIGELERTSRMIAGVDVGVVTRKGAGTRATYALDAMAEILPWYNEYFGTPYPLPKLDMIAVPGQSQFFGAMENWGAILYFEPFVLVDPARASESQRQGVFTTVAHEVAHQWFGDLVTMAWWDDVWLNEGFATWMASKVMTALHPQWKPELLVVNGSRERAMTLDAGSATHAVVRPVTSMETVAQAFDDIAYLKGEAVIRMLEETLGEDGFRAGMRRYMKRYAYANAVTDQLWAELEAATAKPVVAIAHDFTLQPGVPLVTVAAEPCSSGTTAVTLVQSRFETDEPWPQPLSWRIPLRVRALAGTTEANVLMTPGASTTVRVPGCGPIVVNSGVSSYVRTLYDPAALERLRQSLAEITDLDKSGLLNDVWALGKAGRLSATTYLDFALAIPANSDSLIWTNVANKLAEIDRIFDDSSMQAAWRRVARAILQPHLQRLGWASRPGQDANEALLRERLITVLGSLDDRTVITTARNRFHRSAYSTAALPAPIRDAVLYVTALHADVATWREIHARALQEKDPEEKLRMYERLGLPLDEALAKGALVLALSGEPPLAVAPAMITTVALRHPEQSFDFAVANERAVFSLIEASSRWSYIPRLARGSSDPALAEKLRAYELAVVPEDARPDAEKSVAEIRRRARNYAQSRPQLEAWVETQKH